MAWDKKYRPQTFGDVLGQDGTVQVLRARLSKGAGLDSSYVFAGPAGTGKTTLARILARSLLCPHRSPEGEPCNTCDNCQSILDGSSSAFRELDAASSGTIEHVRKIVEDLPYAVLGAEKRIVLFDEMHRMSRDSQDVLLKPLEEKKFIGIFCTTEPHKVRPTISSRCETHLVRFPTREEIAGRVRGIMGKEGVGFDEDGILTAIDFCGGHVRDVLNRLEMVSQMGPCTLAAVREYLDLGVVTQYYDILLNLSSPGVTLPLVESLCDRVGAEAVLSGLAEAAMNSYRLQHKMLANFAQLDRDKASALYGCYGDALTSLADYFLGLRRPTTLGVVCAVTRCASGVPSSSAPVQVQVVGALQTPATNIGAAPLVGAAPPEGPISDEKGPETPKSTVTSNNSPSRPPPAASNPAISPVWGRLTPFEVQHTPSKLPRGAARPVKVLAASPVEKQRILTAVEFRNALLGRLNG